MSLKIYSDFGYKRYFAVDSFRQYMRKVAVQHVERGIIVNEQIHGFGVFDNNFKFVKSCRQVRRNNGQFVPKFDHKNVPYEDKDVVFLGNVYPAFGHFLLEHMNRAWALLDKKYQNLWYVLINNQDIDPVPNYMFNLLKLVGVPRNRIIILNKTTRFRNVYIPDQAFNIPLYSSKEFGDTFDFMAKQVPELQKDEVYEKIYVSRDAMKNRRTHGEKYISGIFEKNGFKIIYPETLPLEKQIALVNNCKVLAGCAGTALHLALFMKPGGTVIQIRRNKKHNDNAACQHLVNLTKGLNSVFISGSVEKYTTTHFTNAPQIIGLTKYMRKFFDDNEFKYDKNSLVIDKKTWDEYIADIDNYNKNRGGVRSSFYKERLVHISAWFVPGRERRGAWRRWLSKKLKI